MKTPRMANAVGYIEEELIAAAAEYKRKEKGHWMKWASVAACFAVLAIAGTAILPSLLGSGSDGRYKDHSIRIANYAVVWPWEYQTVYEKYTQLNIDGVQYRGSGHEISDSNVGDRIGSYTVAGYDAVIDGRKYTETFDVYELKNAARSRFVAVKMNGRYYGFKRDEYAPPATLGELMELVDLAGVMKLGHFSEGGDGPDAKHYVLNRDEDVWAVLAECGDAAFVEDQMWTVHGREYLSFTITSEVLGVYKVAMYVTQDGYLWTNAFDYQYLFRIGEEAAGKIIRYAKENSVEAEYEPYRNSVAGTITEITDEYILVDDSLLCNNSEDGIAYKVLLNDLRLSRYVDHGIIEVGDTVQITCESEPGSDNTIADAISIAKATIFGGDMLIPE